MEIKGKNRINPNFSMSSMTDIVFLLLIFFMLTSTMVTQNALELKLPKAKGETLQQETVNLSITNQGEFYLNKTAIEKGQVVEMLAQALEDSPNKSFVLRVEEDVPAKQFYYVLGKAYENGWKPIMAADPNLTADDQ